MAAAPTPDRNETVTGADQDPVWTDLVDWLAQFPGGAGVEDSVRLIHNQGAFPPRGSLEHWRNP